jgi:hypothetical protein
MAAVHDILSNELIREIIAIRIDTLWKMIGLKRQDMLPDVGDEGATGKFDNKGAIFIPGGLVYRDVDEERIHYDTWTAINAKSFRNRIRTAMRFDNATLCFPDGIAAGINLDSGFFSKVARRILTYKKAAYRRKKTIGRDVANEVGSVDIIRSQCPPYMKPPYGARTRISTCIAIGLVDPPMFYAHCKAQHNLSSRQSEGFVKKINVSVKPIKADSGETLFPPFVTVCHDTRYKPNNLVGLTRILGIGKFGEFATLTIEGVTKQLLKEIKRKRQVITADVYCAEYDGAAYVLVLRVYAPTNPGKRSLAYAIRVVSPHKDLGLDIGKIGQAACRRYHLSK